MANKKKEETAIVEEAVEIKNDIEVKEDPEKKKLEEQIAEMKAQMELMAKMIASAGDKKVEEPTAKKDRFIRFVNLVNGTLVLKGSSFHDIVGRFNHADYSEREARLIVANMPKLIRSGKVYIADAQFVKENDLEDVYGTILSDKQLEELLIKDASYIIETYKNASDGQKDIIIQMIIDKRISNQQVDANVLVELGRLSGKDLLGVEADEE